MKIILVLILNTSKQLIYSSLGATCLHYKQWMMLTDNSLFSIKNNLSKRQQCLYNVKQNFKVI